MSILIYMGHAKLPELSDYWSTSVFYESQFMKLINISRDRWIANRSALLFTRNEMPETASDSEGSELSDDNTDKQFLSSSRVLSIHGEIEPISRVRAILELFRRRCRAVLQPERDICFDELAGKAHHRAYPNLIFHNLHKHAGVGFKLCAICTSDGYITDFEPAAIGNTELSPRNAMLNLCRSLSHKNHRMFADNLFVSMASITASYELLQQVFLSGTASKNCIGFPSVLKLHSEKGFKYLDLQTVDYEAIDSTGAPMTVATVWCDSEKTRFLGAGAGTQECQLQRRKRSKGKTSGHGKRAIGRVFVGPSLLRRCVF